MKKRIMAAVVVFVVVLTVLLLLIAPLRTDRKDDELCFIAIITQVDSENNIAYANYAQRKPDGSLWDKLLERKLPESIKFDISHLDVDLKELDVITGYYICGSIDGQTVEVLRIESALPGDIKYYDDARAMVRAIALGNMDEAWSFVYQAQADPNLKDNLDNYAQFFDNNEVKMFNQYKCEKTGDFESANDVYTETTYYKLYVFVSDSSEEPDYYAKITARKDSNGEGIISLEIFEEYPA